MTRNEFELKLGVFCSAHGGVMPGLIVIHPINYLNLSKVFAESKYASVHIINSHEVPVSEPIFAFTGEQYFLPLTHPQHSMYQRRSAAEIKINFNGNNTDNHSRPKKGRQDAPLMRELQQQRIIVHILGEPVVDVDPIRSCVLSHKKAVALAQRMKFKTGANHGR